MLKQLLLFVSATFAWDLSHLKIPDDHRIRHVSIYCNRAFLCIDQQPSLIEAPWPESLMGIPAKVFTPSFSDIRPQLFCDTLISARSTDIDRHGNLWVLDNGGLIGDYECLPKLSIHSLPFANERIHVREFMDFRNFETIVLDPLGMTEVRAYITFKDKSFILVYSLKDKKYAKINFESSTQPIVTELAIMKNDKMLLLDQTHGHLYTTQIRTLRHSPLASLESQAFGSKMVQFLVPLNFIGGLLGRARSLSIHPKGQVFYILERDGAVMVWNRKMPMNAENHQVVYQTWRNISQIVFGWRDTVWAIFDKPKRGKVHCAKINFHER